MDEHFDRVPPYQLTYYQTPKPRLKFRSTVVAQLGATPMQVAIAWLLQRSPHILMIPGTSSVAHLRDNLAAAQLHLPDDALVQLNAIATPAACALCSSGRP